VDIDTYSVAPTGLEDAIRKAWTATGLEPPLGGEVFTNDGRLFVDADLRE
jgi:hypothetical protein